DVFRLDLVPPREVELFLSQGLLVLFDQERRQAHLPQTADDGGLGLRLDRSLNDLSGAVPDFVRVRGRHDALSPSGQACEFFGAVATLEAELEADLAGLDE